MSLLEKSDGVVGLTQGVTFLIYCSCIANAYYMSIYMNMFVSANVFGYFIYTKTENMTHVKT